MTVIVFRGGQNLPLFAAQTKGFFAKRGAPPNCQSGWLWALANHAQHVRHAVGIDKPDVALVIAAVARIISIPQTDIRSLGDLRGKTVVLHTANSKKNGLNRDDYKDRWRVAEATRSSAK